MKIAAFAALLLLCTLNMYPQDEPARRGSIPEELLRPRRDEAPRYPIDTVIGALGRGQAPQEAYDLAQNAAAAFLAGNMDAPVFAPVNKVFLEGCMSMLDSVNPQFYRIGGGREEPDGSVSFLVRFVGREQGMIGELYIRFEEWRPPPPPPVKEPEPEPALETEIIAEGEPAEDAVSEDADAPELATPPEVAEALPPPPPPPVPQIPAVKKWLFEDLILEEARSREQENREDRHRFDFSPYERIF